MRHLIQAVQDTSPSLLRTTNTNLLTSAGDDKPPIPSPRQWVIPQSLYRPVASITWRESQECTIGRITFDLKTEVPGKHGVPMSILLNEPESLIAKALQGADDEVLIVSCFWFWFRAVHGVRCTARAGACSRLWPRRRPPRASRSSGRPRSSRPSSPSRPSDARSTKHEARGLRPRRAAATRTSRSACHLPASTVRPSLSSARPPPDRCCRSGVPRSSRLCTSPRASSCREPRHPGKSTLLYYCVLYTIACSG